MLFLENDDVVIGAVKYPLKIPFSERCISIPSMYEASMLMQYEVIVLLPPNDHPAGGSASAEQSATDEVESNHAIEVQSGIGGAENGTVVELHISDADEAIVIVASRSVDVDSGIEFAVRIIFRSTNIYSRTRYNQTSRHLFRSI